MRFPNLYATIMLNVASDCCGVLVMCILCFRVMVRRKGPLGFYIFGDGFNMFFLLLQKVLILSSARIYYVILHEVSGMLGERGYCLRLLFSGVAPHRVLGNFICYPISFSACKFEIASYQVSGRFVVIHW